MEPQHPSAPEVLFCELCNASVPLQDFEAGTAVRHNGRAIGACCMASLRGHGGANVAAATTAAAGTAAAGAGDPRGALHDHRLLPLGIALLGAVAAATLFLDYRIDQAESRVAHANEELGTSLKSQAEVVQGISVSLDGVVRRADFDRAQAQLGALEAAQRSAADQVQALARDHAQAQVGVQAALKALQDAEARRPDHGPMLLELRTQLQKQSVSLAELLASPRPRDPAPAAPVAAPVVVPGVRPELAHQIARLKDEDAATRFEAVDELLRSKDESVLEHLLPMAKDTDLFVRRVTVEGIRDFHKPAVVEVLLVALADPEEIVRDAAWQSLKEVTGQKLPFEAGASRDVRARAQQRWQEWWDKNRDSFGT